MVVCALMCSSLPVVAPLLWIQWKSPNRSTPSQTPSNSNRVADFNNRVSCVAQPSRVMSRGFGKLENKSDATIDLRTALRGDIGMPHDSEREAWPLKKITPTYSAIAGTPAKREGVMNDERDIMVEREVRVTAESSERGHKNGDNIV